MCQSLGSGVGKGVRQHPQTKIRGAERRLSRMYLTNTDDIDDFRARHFLPSED